MEARPAVLIVDDEDGPREALRFVLDADFEVETVGSGRAALDRLATRPFAVALLDLAMPGELSGLATLEAIREAGLQVEVIVLTANGTLESAVRCMRLQARDFLAKPFSPAVIRAAVSAAAAAGSARRQASAALLGDLSHEVRTPLSAILGYAEMLREEAGPLLDGDLGGALERSQANSTRLLTYLDGLLFLADLEGDVARARAASALRLRPWLERLARRQAEATKTSLSVRCAEDVVTWTDADALGRLLDTLLHCRQVPVGEAADLRIEVEADRAGGSLAIRIESFSPVLPPLTLPTADDWLTLASGIQDQIAARAARLLSARVRTTATTGGHHEIRVEIPIDSRPLALGAAAMSAPARFLASSEHLP